MKSRKRIIVTLLVCVGLSALAYFAYMFPFYEFETNDYEASKEKLFSLEYLKTLVVYTVPPEPSARSFRAMLPHIKSH